MIEIIPYGDKAVLVKFGNKINLKINAFVHSFDALLAKEKIEGVIESIPAYSSVTVIYDPKILDFNSLAKELKALLKKGRRFHSDSHNESIEIPVVYGGSYGPDLEFVAQYNNLSPQEVVKIHTSREYVVYMVGFTPGFAYLGGMSSKIATPRLSDPRESVPAGSVGIGGSQTGIYPIESPGGWRIIGRTPLKLFDMQKEPPVLLKPGMKVKFVSIDESEYQRVREISK